MTRIYHSVFAAVVKSLASLLHCSRTSEQRYSVSSRATALVERNSRRALGLGLVISLLATSTPAASQTIVGLAGEWQAGLAFWLRGNGLPERLRKAVTGQNPDLRPQERQDDRDARVARLHIYPGDTTIGLDDRINLAAIAYDTDGNTVGGTKTTWSIQPIGGTLLARIGRNGEFEAKNPGVFRVSAEAAGQRAEATIIVLDGPRRPKPTDVPVSVKQISSRTRPASVVGSQALPAKSIAKSAGAKIRRASFAHKRRDSLRPEPMPQGGGSDGWNDTNYWSADDPGNSVGNPPGAPLDGGAGSGDFQLVAPIYSASGRGINISLGASYQGRVWNKANSEMTYDIDRGSPAPGWSLGFGKVLYMGPNSGSMFVDADGTRHSYSGTITNYGYGILFLGHTTDGTFIDYGSWTLPSGVTTWGEVNLPNGTQLHCYAPGAGGVYPTDITDPNGNFITITYPNNTGPNIQTITDTLGRAISFSYDPNNLLTAITAAGFNGGTRTLVRFHYRQLTLNAGFAWPAITSVVMRNSVPWVVDAIYYPATGTGYWFGDSDSYSSYGMIAKVIEQRGMGFSATSLNDQGIVTQGQMTRQEVYNYPLAANYSLTDAPTYTSMIESWTRDGTNIDSSTTAYSSSENASPRIVTITLPNGTTSTQYSFNTPGQWNDGLVYSDETRDASNTLLQSSSSTWEQGAYNSPRPVRVQKTDERGQTTAAEFSYGPVYNQVSEVRDYDYGGTTLLRATRTQYQNSASYTAYSISSNNAGRHIFNLPLVVEVYAGDNVTRVSRTEYQYDGQTLTNRPAVIQFSQIFDPYAEQNGYCTWEPDWSDPDCTGDCSLGGCDGYCPQIESCPYNPITDYRGNVTQVTSYSDAVNLTGAVSETRRYDITGNLVTASTSCCQQTSFNYTTDTQYAYPLSQTRGSATDPYAQVTTSATYDFNTGLVLSATDANGRTSQTSYFSETLRPQTASLPSGAHTDYAYDDTAMSVTETTYLEAHPTHTTIADQNVKLLNGRGQVRQEKALGANSVWDFVDTVYDNMGNVSQQSRPYRSGETLQWSTVAYDSLGRTTTVTAPDGSTTQTFYNEATRPDVASTAAGETTRLQDAWGRERWGRTDAQGRLVEVVEPNPSGSGSVATGGLLTTYSYNTLGNLTGVAQGAQTRSFKYDSLGRLTQQKLAETSATLNDAGTYVGSGTWSDVFTYDERSNLTSHTDARGVKTVYNYSGDALNRLQSVSWDTSGFRDYDHPILDAATVSYQYRTKSTGSQLLDIGQLNSVTTSGVSTESYIYDSENRVSSKTLTLTSRSSYPFATNYIYDALDRITDVRYPAEYGNGTQPRKLVHQDYDIASRLSNLTVDGATHSSQIVYNAASQTTSLKVGATGANQITENYGYHAQTGLLDNQTVTRGATTLLNLSYEYVNGNGKRTGQLTKILNNLNHSKDRGYAYDALGRLTQATGGQASAPLWTQTYSYDRYGNRTSVSASGYSAKLNTPDPQSAIGNRQLAMAQRGSSPTASEGSDATATANTGSAGVSPAMSAQREPGSSPTVREGSSNNASANAGSAGILPAMSAQRERGTSENSDLRSHHASRSAPNPMMPQGAPPPTFTDPDLLASGGVQIKALHITELRTAINDLRAQLGLSAYSWQQPTATGGVVQNGGLISADPILEMRTALDQALGAPSPAYAAGLAQGQPIKAIHIQELRNRVLAAWNGGTSSCPPGQTLLIDQFVKNFYQGALARQPNANELQSWTSQLRQAYYQGQTQLRAAVQYMGRQLFKSQEYANRGRDDHNYVYDLYWAYLQRQPDASGWGFWTNDAAANGWDHTRLAFETDSTEFFPKLASLCPGSSGSAPIPLDGLANMTYNTTSNRINKTGFQYDAAGNQTQIVRADGSLQKFKYDAANRLVQVRDQYDYTLQTITYGESNERLISDEGGYRTYYDCEGGSTTAEYFEVGSSTTPVWSMSHIYLGGRLLSTLTPNGAGGELVQYHHPDRLATRLVTNAQDSTYFEQVGLPFGTALDSESSGSTKRRFTSYDRSPVTGLDYANNRHYDSQQGRFTQVDPIGMSAASPDNPQSLNMYAYCGNDPVNRMDPEGLFWGKLFKWVTKIIKWIGIAVLIATVVVLTCYFAPAASTAFKFFLWGSKHLLPFLAKYLGWTTGGLLVPIGAGSPQWNPESKSLFGNSFQGQNGKCPPDCQEQISLPPVSAGDIYANYSTLEKALRRVGNWGTGIADEVTTVPFANLSLTKWWRHRQGWEGDADEDSTSYQIGGYSGVAIELTIEALTGEAEAKAAAKAGGWASSSGRIFGRHKIGLLNRNDILRVGWSWKGTATRGREVFRIAIGSARSRIHRHITLWFN